MSFGFFYADIFVGGCEDVQFRLVCVMELECGFADVERGYIDIFLGFLFVVSISFDISVVDFG